MGGLCLRGPAVLRIRDHAGDRAASNESGVGLSAFEETVAHRFPGSLEDKGEATDECAHPDRGRGVGPRPGSSVVEVGFADGQTKELGLEPLRWGDAFAAPTADYDLFCAVEVDTDAGTIVWPSGADITPRALPRGQPGGAWPEVLRCEGRVGADRDRPEVGGPVGACPNLTPKSSQCRK